MNLEKLCEIFKQCDGILITSPHNLRYFTNFKGGEGIALITEKERYLFVDPRYTMAAIEEAVEFNVIEYSAGKKIAEIKDKLNGISKLGFEDLYLSFFEYKTYSDSFENIELIPVSDKVEITRMIKSAEEIESLKKAEKIAVSAFSNTLPLIKEGVTETEVAAEIEYQMRKMGAEGPSFETVVVSGYKSGMPHGKPGQKKLEQGDFVTMDFGCVYNGYCSDMTRTVVIGKADDEQKKIYEIVLRAQLAGLDAIKEGVTCSFADKVSRKIIEDSGYGKYFGHSLGHGVGMLIHEMPNVSSRCNIVLKENMIVTCEPGIYLQNGGVRIEDMVRVTKDGCENLTDFTKELLEL